MGKPIAVATTPYPNLRTNGTSSQLAPTSVLPSTPSGSFDNHFTNSGLSNGNGAAPSMLDPSFLQSPVDHENSLLDPKLLMLQPSPQHMLPTPAFTVPDPSQLPTSVDESPDSLPGPSPFTWNDFTFFDELNHSLGSLNPTDDMQSQIDQLMSNMLPSGSATCWPSTPNVSGLHDGPVNNESSAPHDSSAPLFRIPAANEVPIKGVHSAPPPTRNIEKKLDESSWKSLVSQIHTAEAVNLYSIFAYCRK